MSRVRGLREWGVGGAWRGRQARWRVAGIALLIASASPILRRYLVEFPDEIWQVDLEVYREGARSLVQGRQVYDWLTDNPQYLPFTYPPFSALLGAVLLLAPFAVVGWAWSFLQLGLLWAVTGLGFRPFLERFGTRRGLVQGGVAALLVHLQPVQEGIRFGQVNAVLVALCLADVARRRAGWWPRGSLTGLAAAIKLTPAVFWFHYAVARRWRALAVSVGTAAAATVLTALVAPSASIVFWTDAMLDPARVGPNADTQNQSLRGMLLRIGPPEGRALSLTWLLLAVAVLVVALWLSARLDRLGEPVAVVGVLGMVAVLISPVSWTHHLYWGLVVLAALLGDGRQVGRVVATVAMGAVLWFEWPWWGADWQRDGGLWRAVGLVVEQADCWFALASLGLLWWFVVRPAGLTPAVAPAAAGPAGATESECEEGRRDDGPASRRPSPGVPAAAHPRGPKRAAQSTPETL
jgi:alpha-1,2-mannosyltransferase